MTSKRLRLPGQSGKWWWKQLHVGGEEFHLGGESLKLLGSNLEKRSTILMCFSLTNQHGAFIKNVMKRPMESWWISPKARIFHKSFRMTSVVSWVVGRGPGISGGSRLAVEFTPAVFFLMWELQNFRPFAQENDRTCHKSLVLGVCVCVLLGCETSYLRWWWHNFSEAKSVIAVEQVASSKSWFPGWKNQSRFCPTEFIREHLCC